MSSFSRRFCKRFALSGSFTVRSTRPQPLDAVWRMDTNLGPRGRRAKTIPERALHTKAYGAEHAQRLFCAGSKVVGRSARIRYKSNHSERSAGSECEGGGHAARSTSTPGVRSGVEGGLKGHPPGISRDGRKRFIGPLSLRSKRFTLNTLPLSDRGASLAGAFEMTSVLTPVLST